MDIIFKVFQLVSDDLLTFRRRIKDFTCCCISDFCAGCISDSRSVFFYSLEEFNKDIC